MKLLTVLTLTLCLAGCGGGAGDTVSTSCEEAFEEAAAIPGEQSADEELRGPLTECETYDEGLQALRDHPAALGLNERADIQGPMEISNFCAGADGPVCDDARDQGVLDE